MGGEMNPFPDVLFHKEQAFSAAGLWTVVIVLLPPGAVRAAGRPVASLASVHKVPITPQPQ